MERGARYMGCPIGAFWVLFSFGKMYRFDPVLPTNFRFDSILSWLGVSFSELSCQGLFILSRLLM